METLSRYPSRSARAIAERAHSLLVAHADNLPEPERDARLAALDSAFARRDLHLFLVELGAGRDPL